MGAGACPLSSLLFLLAFSSLHPRLESLFTGQSKFSVRSFCISNGTNADSVHIFEYTVHEYFRETNIDLAGPEYFTISGNIVR